MSTNGQRHRPAEGIDPRTARLLRCGLATLPVPVAFVVAASAVTPGYSHVSHTFSQLGAQGRPHPWIMNVGFVLFGGLVVAFAFGVYRWLGAGPAARQVWLSVTVFGTAVIAAAVFQDDLEGGEVPPNLQGRLHGTFAVIAFVGLVVGLLAFAKATHGVPQWGPVARSSLMVAVVLIGLGMSFFYVPRNFKGLVQRLFSLLMLGWMAVVSWTGLGGETGRHRRDRTIDQRPRSV